MLLASCGLFVSAPDVDTVYIEERRTDPLPKEAHFDELIKKLGDQSFADIYYPEVQNLRLYTTKSLKFPFSITTVAKGAITVGKNKNNEQFVIPLGEYNPVNCIIGHTSLQSVEKFFLQIFKQESYSYWPAQSTDGRMNDTKRTDPFSYREYIFYKRESNKVFTSIFKIKSISLAPAPTKGARQLTCYHIGKGLRLTFRTIVADFYRSITI